MSLRNRMGTGSGHNFSNLAEINQFLQSNDIRGDKKFAAYLSLIATGQLYQLKKFAEQMDFHYHDERGNALVYAASLGKADVVAWLLQEVEHFKHLDAVARTNVIFAAVKNFKLNVLRLLAGLGWNLDVRDGDGNTPVVLFARAGFNYFLTELIKPDGSFGLPLQQRVLDAANKLNPHDLLNHPEVRYFPKSLERQLSYIEISNAGNPEVYFAENEIGEGMHGSVRRFTSRQNPLNIFSVKCRKAAAEKPVNDIAICEAIKNTNEELRMFLSVYPQFKGFITHFIDDETGEYNYRMIYTYLNGSSLLNLFETIDNADQLVNAILAACVELNRIHLQNKVVHGDAKTPNVILMAKKQAGIPEYVAYWIDLYLATTQGDMIKLIGYYKGFPPEYKCKQPIKSHVNQDIYCFGYDLNSRLAVWQKRYAAAYQQLTEKYPELFEFCRASMQKDPAARPSLATIIEALSAKSAENARRNEALTMTGSVAKSFSSFWNYKIGIAAAASITLTTAAALWKYRQGRK